MTDPILLRKEVRFHLSTLPKTRTGSNEPPRIGEALLFKKLVFDFHDLQVDELHAAMLWNLSRGYAEFSRNEDTARDEWNLTADGWRKEGF